jgi:hypothetical protein
VFDERLKNNFFEIYQNNAAIVMAYTYKRYKEFRLISSSHNTKREKQKGNGPRSWPVVFGGLR